MKEFLLKDGIKVIVDDDDYEWLCAQALAFFWGTSRKVGKDNIRIYAAHGRSPKTTGVAREMHRAIMQRHGFDVKEKGIDHVLCDSSVVIDNRKTNLRICSQQENTRNQRVQIRNKRSKYKGVTWHHNKKTGYKAWVARINTPKRLTIGYFRTEEDAAQAYNWAAALYFREFALYNERV